MHPSPIPHSACFSLFLCFVCVCGGVVAPSTRYCRQWHGSTRAPPWVVFVVLGGKVHLLHPALNILPSVSSLPDRKTSRTALLFLRSFISTAFLALFLSRGSQHGCVCVFQHSFMHQRSFSFVFWFEVLGCHFRGVHGRQRLGRSPSWWHDAEKLNIYVGYVPPSESIPVST